MMGSEESSARDVCVVICDEDIPEQYLRQQLRDVFPLRIVGWKNREYHAVIKQLRPRAIVVAAPNGELALDSARLISCLFSEFEPTVVSATISPELGSEIHLTVQHLGPMATARISSLSDLSLT